MATSIVLSLVRRRAVALPPLSRPLLSSPASTTPLPPRPPHPCSLSAVPYTTSQSPSSSSLAAGSPSTDPPVPPLPRYGNGTAHAAGHAPPPPSPPRLWLTPLGPKPYSVPRNQPYGTLPVYTKVIPAKKQVWTLVRKVGGDLNALRDHLAKDFPSSHPYVKPRTGQVLLRGRVVKEVMLWLQDHGF